MAITLDGTSGSTQPSVAMTGATSGTVTLTPPAVAGTQGYTLPSALPTASGQALTATTAGVMSWATASASPAGSTTQFQYNNAGTAAGAANLLYNANGPIVTSLGVGNTTPSASGAGIAFPATQSASTDANTLDDYEEGSWTPQLTGSGGGAYTMSGSNAGRYIRVGRIVTVEAVVQWSGGGPYVGNLQVNGLPFAQGGTTRSVGSFTLSSGAAIVPNGAFTWLTTGIDIGSTSVWIMQNGTGGYNPSPTVASSGTVFGFGLTYIAA